MRGRRWAGWLLLGAALFCSGAAIESPEDPVGFVIVSQRIRLEIIPLASMISYTDTMTIRRSNEEARIRFGLSPFIDVREVRINGDIVGFERRRDLLEIEDLPDDELFDVAVTAEGNISFRSEYTSVTAEYALLREEEVLPRGPRAITFGRYSLNVPSGWTAITIGELVEVDSTNGSKTFTWEMNQPITLVGWFFAGRVRSTSQVINGIPISIHRMGMDTLPDPPLATRVGQILSFYGERFTPYRFPSLNIIEVENWVAGKNVLAIATPSMILVKSTAFHADDPMNSVESILPHEIAHQWWPASVFVEDEDLAFLSEGLCEYSALLFNEARGHPSRRDSLGKSPFLRSLILRAATGRDLPLRQKADLRSIPTHYLKAAFVHHMLRHSIGDSAFFRLCSEFARRFHMRRCSLTDFHALAEEISGKRLGWFFDQWVRRKGIPALKLYNVSSVLTDAGWEVRGRVRLVGYERYTTFADIGVETREGLTLKRLWMGARDDAAPYRNDLPFTIAVPDTPGRVLLDPRGDLLKIQKLPAAFIDLREPSDGIMIVGTQRDAGHLLSLARSDSVTMDRAGWSIVIRPDTSVTLAHLQNERVFLYGRGDQNSIVNTLDSVFPHGFRGDSAVVNGEAVSDTALALLQIVDNPYAQRGLLAWIAPLGAESRPELLPFDASWLLVRGREEIASGTWIVRDEDCVVELR